MRIKQGREVGRKKDKTNLLCLNQVFREELRREIGLSGSGLE